jgi:glycosyltransferase involved in cell wall biosynthesis
MAELIPYVDCFLAPSSFLRDQLVQWGVPRERIRQCDYGTAQLPYVLPATHDGRRRSRFAFLGGNNYEKGLHVLLTAFRGFRDGELVVYGERSPEIQMEFSDVFAQENVTHAGPIDDAEKAIVLPQFDALIVPSIWFENSPLVIHEAFAARVPVICSGIGGMAELVTNGLDGLHFEVGDAKSLRDVLARCVRERELLGRLRRGIQAPKPMEEHVRNEILPLYLELLNRNSFPQTRGAPVCESQAKALEATSRPC